ncbi:MAG: trypsin-like peptidase domain-containing protein [Clostridia bacterium]|nr:trypsin-like peptidase domain-containing protein [Clostridia bacterium]
MDNYNKSQSSEELTTASGNHETETVETQTAEDITAPTKEEGSEVTTASSDTSEEYEVSFDSTTGDFSYTPGFNTSPSYGTGNTANLSSSNQKAKKRPLILHLTAIIIALALLVTSFAAGALTVAHLQGLLKKRDGTSNGELGQINGTKLTVDKSDLEVAENAVAAATLVAYDSNLLIEAYSDTSGSSLLGTGSGVLWNAEGYIVTCNHVVEGSKTVKVTFTDGSSYFAESMATDPITDLAILKITLAEGSEVCPITARDTSVSELMLGETVIAIGNPLGYFTNTVTDGIISSFEREISVEGKTMKLMQTNVAVNSGNSGGGLFDINGSLVGIVNAKIAETGVEGIGFAIPIDTVIDVVTQLADKGYVSGRPAIGIECVSITNYNYKDMLAAYPDLEKYAVTSSGRWGISTINEGIYIVGLQDTIKYASESGEKLKFGDKIYSIASDNESGLTPGKDLDSFINYISSKKVGDTLNVTVIRGGKALTVSVVLGEKKI